MLKYGLKIHLHLENYGDDKFVHIIVSLWHEKSDAFFSEIDRRYFKRPLASGGYLYTPQTLGANIEDVLQATQKVMQNNFDAQWNGLLQSQMSEIHYD